MRKSLITILIVLTISFVFISGCIEVPEQEYIEEIVVSGMNDVVEINNDNPIKLIITGMDAVVNVSYGTDVREIIITSMNSVVYIPQDANPKITITGTDSRVERY